jgi:hypothetical protein
LINNSYGNKTFAQFDLFLVQHVVESMIFSVDIATLAPCCYFHHQTIHQQYYKFMISTCPPKKKLAHNFELFFFESLISYNTRLIIQCESCTLFFKLYIVLATINHDQESYI